MAALTDYFQAGPAIQARLRAALPDLANVADLAPLARAVAGAVKEEELAQKIGALVPRSPAVFVGFDADMMTFDADGGGQGIEQRWLVVLAVRNAADAAKGGALLRDAGPLLLGVIQALNGWRPDIQYMGELRRIPAPRPFHAPGIGLFPLAFTVPVYLAGGNL